MEEAPSAIQRLTKFDNSIKVENLEPIITVEQSITALACRLSIPRNPTTRSVFCFECLTSD